MEIAYINMKEKKHNGCGKVNLFFWMLFIILSAYEGYFPGGIGELTRYITIFWIVYMLIKTRKYIFKVSLPQFALMLWILYYIISMIWSDNISQANLYVFTVSLMVMLYVLVQYFKYNNRDYKIIKETYKLVSVSIAFLSILFFIDIAEGTRRVLYLFGMYLDPNNQVAIVATGCGLCLYDIFKESGINRAINIIGYIICVYSIFQCGSRSGILVLSLQIIVILLFWHPKNDNIFKEIVKWGIIMLFVIVAINFMSNHISLDIIDRIFGKGTLKFTDGTEREEIWSVGLEYFNRNPIFGNGWGSYECHNTFLTMMVDIGIIGNIPFYYVILRIFFKALKNKDIAVLMILVSGLLPAFFIGAQNKRFFWGAIIIVSILINCKGDKNVYQ